MEGWKKLSLWEQLSHKRRHLLLQRGLFSFLLCQSLLGEAEDWKSRVLLFVLFWFYCCNAWIHAFLQRSHLCASWPSDTDDFFWTWHFLVLGPRFYSANDIPVFLKVWLLSNRSSLGTMLSRVFEACPSAPALTVAAGVGSLDAMVIFYPGAKRKLTNQLLPILSVE